MVNDVDFCLNCLRPPRRHDIYGKLGSIFSIIFSVYSVIFCIEMVELRTLA